MNLDEVERWLLLPEKLDLPHTLGELRYGPRDPAFRRGPEGIWRTSTTPDGPATMLIQVRRPYAEVRTWGPGARWLAASAPGVLGLTDDVSDFRPVHPVVAPLAARFAGLRFPRTARVWDSLLPAILSQKVTGLEAFAWWRRLLFKAGVPAPGPAPEHMRVPPTPEATRRLADWDWHTIGVPIQPRTTIRRSAVVAESLERVVEVDHAEAVRRLRTVRGVGLWTANEVARRALGDADAPAFGDYHIPNLVGFAFTGAGTDDDGMARLLEEFRPHRARVVRLLELGHPRMPRHGPKRTVPDFRRM